MLFRRKQRYSIAEIHTYISDMDVIAKLHADSFHLPIGGKAALTEYDHILHVMREVLLRMVETLAPEDRKQINVKAEDE